MGDLDDLGSSGDDIRMVGVSAGDPGEVGELGDCKDAVYRVSIFDHSIVGVGRSHSLCVLEEGKVNLFGLDMLLKRLLGHPTSDRNHFLGVLERKHYAEVHSVDRENPYTIVARKVEEACIE